METIKPINVKIYDKSNMADGHIKIIMSAYHSKMVLLW